MKTTGILILFAWPLLFYSCGRQEHQQAATTADTLTVQELAVAEKLTGLTFTDAERDTMLTDVISNLKEYRSIRKFSLPNGVSPVLWFNPVPPGVTFRGKQESVKWNLPENVRVPANSEELAFYSVAELASLLKSKKITSTGLTKMYISRLKKYGDTLHSVITITEELALQQAASADEELAKNIWRGPLHGIPYGVKDLFAVKGYKTTWGAPPYKDQEIDETATVVKKLEQSGAVLVAKLTMGALAWGDIWFGGKTRNPWNPEEGSSGSSAGSASSTAAGLVAFAIGTETYGSIVSPSTRCSTTGLRPTFGRVSRTGAMALSWSMDKVGPICRSVEDCALVFDVIRGPDQTDQSVVDLPFNYKSSVNLKNLRIGYLKEDFDKDDYNRSCDSLSILKLRELGANLLPVRLPDSLPIESLLIILYTEAAAAFDELTRSDRDSLMVQQIRLAWPNMFRQARFIPAVEYIQANRLRSMVIQEMHNIMKNYDVILAPTYGGNQLLLTNLTGHPCVVVPNGKNTKDSHPSICFIGNLYDEATILTVAKAYQEATEFHKKHPPGFME